MPPHPRSLRPPSSPTCRIAPLGATLTIRCDAASLPLVLGQLAPWSPLLVELDDEADLTVDADGDAHVLTERPDTLDGPPAVRRVEAGALAVAVQDWLDEVLTRRVQGLVPVHAGVLEWDGKAALFPAPSGAGKTTLIGALRACGAVCYSDELAFLDGRGWVHPYPRHLTTREPDGRRVVQQGSGSDAGSLPPLPVGWVVGLRFEPGASLHLTPIASSEAVLLLLANTAFRLDVSGSLPPALLRVSGAARAFRGVRGDAAEQAAALLDSLSRHALNAAPDERA